MVWWFFKQQT